MKYLIVILAISLAACGPVQVSYDYDKQTNFDNYKTYNYFSDLKTNLNELDDKRLFTQLDSVLESRGFTQAEHPDFFVDISLSSYETQSSNSIGVGVGGGGGNVGVGVGGGIPIGGRELHQNFLFDFLDGKTQTLFWQAKASGKLKVKSTPQQRKAYFKTLVTKVFSKYPPKKK